MLFVNGLPIVTLELKSEFKQSVQNAIKQYKRTRLSIDPITKKPEPLLTFKRGALVHFAVSHYEVYMATKLDGADTYFLPFNKGTNEGGAGNDVPEDETSYATSYLWQEVLQGDPLCNAASLYRPFAQVAAFSAGKGRQSGTKRVFAAFAPMSSLGSMTNKCLCPGTCRLGLCGVVNR